METNDIARDGTSTFHSSATGLDDIATKFKRINTQKFASGFKNIDATELQSGRPTPEFRVHIDRNAFYALRENPDVRAIRLVGFKDPRQAQWPSDALSAAKTNGSADVVITLRGGSAFSPKSGFMSANAWKAQEKANSRALDDLLTNAGAPMASLETVNHAGVGSVQVRLPHQTLARLYANADPRVLSVSLNRPVATASLTRSTALLNLQAGWNAGYRAAGQSIIIIDTGVRRDHAMFNANGTTKVAFEACFGTSDGSYRSICPQPNASGDSPLGLAGSGAPFSDQTTCTRLANNGVHDCSHGTHVAGIAAGQKSPLVSPPDLQGVALDASIVAVQVFSYDTTNLNAGAYPADMLAALNAVNAVATAPGSYNPYTVNMSIGVPDLFTADCQSYYWDFTNTVQNLASRGVPVVVATGNNYNKNGITWPSCVPQTIKVASVLNDATGMTISNFANLGNPGNFTGPILLAPGGGHAPNGTRVVSASSASSTATKALMGTSMAAPHVAGVYAAVKAGFPGISVADATAWIVGFASIQVTYPLPAPYGTQTFWRLRAPNL